MNVQLPAPCVVVLIGPSSSGKSTWASANFATSEIVSSDTLRGTVGIDENDQAAGTAAFELLGAIFTERVRRRLTTVLDTLGTDASLRQGWLEQGRSAGLPVFAVAFETPLDVCLERNASRSHPLPRSVVQKQHRAAANAIEVVESEGFERVIHGAPPVATVAPQFATLKAPVADETSEHSFGLLISRFDWGDEALATTLPAIALRAESAGFRDLWLMDHFRQIPQVGRPWENIPEAYTALAYLAAHTTSIRLGTLVTGITHRNTALLGKMIATLDVLSGGRANAGLGLAWDKEEHAAYGIDFPPTPERYELLEEAIEMLRLTWGKGAPAFHGEHIRADSLLSYPRPVQEKIPILVGGSGEQKTLRLVAECADAANVFGTPDRVAHKVDVLRSHCETVGRDIEEIEVTHLLNAMPDDDSARLRERVSMLRPSSVSHEDYSARNNAGPTEALTRLFSRFHEAGATHSIVTIPDVHRQGSIEAFGPLITELG